MSTEIDPDITLFPTQTLLEIIFIGEIQAATQGAIAPSDARLYIFNADGTNPISETAFNGGYNPQIFGFNPGVQNFAQFDMQRFLSSPTTPPAVPFPTTSTSTDTGDITFIQTPDGFTWRYQAELQSAIFGFDAADYAAVPALFPLTDPYVASLTPFRAPGDISVTNVGRNTLLGFSAEQTNDRYLLTDEFGNQYLMALSKFEDPAVTEQRFFAANIPDGWTRSILGPDDVLPADIDPGEDILLGSTASGTGEFVAVTVTDNLENVYQQVGWGASGVTLGATIEGFEVWGGVTDDLLLGDPDGTTSFDNEIYGGQGNDTINGAGGEDTIVGGAGDDELTGGADGDVFVFSSDNGSDTVTDYEDADALVFDGEDLIEAVGTSVLLDGDSFDFSDGEASFSFDGADTSVTYTVGDDPATTVTLEGVDLGFVTSIEVDTFWSNGPGGQAGTSGGFIGTLTVENATGMDQIELFADLDLDSFEFGNVWVNGVGNPRSIDDEEGIVEILPTGNPFWQPVFEDGDSVSISFVASTTDADALAAMADGADTFEAFVNQDASLDAFWG